MKFSKDTNAKGANTKSVLLFRGFPWMSHKYMGLRTSLCGQRHPQFNILPSEF